MNKIIKALESKNNVQITITPSMNILEVLADEHELIDGDDEIVSGDIVLKLKDGAELSSIEDFISNAISYLGDAVKKITIELYEKGGNDE